MSEGKSKRSISRMNLHAAGIDLGSRSHYVALPPDVEEPVRQFGCYTEDLEALAAWLKTNGITTVAMESTGVYWVPVFQMLEKHGLDVQLVSTRHMKSVPGRKTDVADCQWIQHLHECGLLRGSFRPADAICVVRAYVRHRDTLTEERGRHILRMQKALEQMNVQLHKVISDITGETGMAIVDAILEGERDGKKLAARRNYRCKLSEEEIAKALVGDFREEHLFCLRQEVDALRFVQKQFDVCESEILARLKAFEAKVEAAELTKAKDERPKNREERSRGGSVVLEIRTSTKGPRLRSARTVSRFLFRSTLRAESRGSVFLRIRTVQEGLDSARAERTLLQGLLQRSPSGRGRQLAGRGSNS